MQQLPKTKQKYKQTQLGEIPEEWQIVTMKQIVKSYRNGIYKLPEYYGRGIPSIRMFNINNGKVNSTEAPLLQVTEKELLDYELKPGDILINRVNSKELVGKAGIVDKGLGTVTFESKNIRVRILTHKSNPYYLNYFLNSDLYYKQIYSKTKAAIGQCTINQEDLNSVYICLPSLSEQKKIASILSKVDELIQKTDQIVKQTQRLKKGLMHILFANKKRLSQIKNIQLGGGPEEWIETTLGRLITLQRGYDLPSSMRNSGDIPIVGANGITGYHNVAKVKGPGVLTGRSGTLGKVYFVNKDYWPLNTSLYVKQFHGCDPKFIFYLLHTIDYEKHNAGTTVPTLNHNLLHPILVCVPKTVKGQQKTASILSNIDGLLEKEKQRKKLLSLLKIGLMQK